MGCAFAGIGKLDKALDYFQQALFVKPGYAEALINYKKLLNFKKIKTGDLK